MAEKRWVPNSHTDETTAERLSKDLNIGKDLALVLMSRGIRNFQEAKAFFRPDISQLHDPFLMNGMEVAVNRILQGFERNEKILIYGDYDVDGTSAVALVYKFISKLHPATGFYIPDRYAEGYGISVQGIDFAAANDYTLIIALDCGIKSVDKVAYATTKGIEFIICDHHLPGDELPEAISILNPKQHGCIYPFKELPGCGIGFKLCQAIAAQKNIPFSELEEYLDLVAVAISADIVPITGENRILTFFGLQKLKANPNKGLKALLEFYFDKPFYEVSDLVFSIGPRINAAGRMAHGKESVELMTADTEEAARLIAESINKRNTDRRDVDQNITREALEMLDSSPDTGERSSTLVFQPEWHKGVVGIVASRLIEKYYRPTIVLCESNGKASGSARSIEGFDLYEAIEACSDLLEQFGGHTHAAGMTLPIENVELFRQRFEEEVRKRIRPEMLIESLKYETEISINRVNTAFMNILKQMSPFGPGNLNPVFRSNNVWDTGYARVVGNNHLQMWLTQDSDRKGIKAIGFGLGHHFEKVSNGQSFDVLYSLEESYWEGKTYLQMMVKDLKFRT